MVDKSVNEVMTSDAWKLESSAEVEKAAKGDEKRKMRSYSSAIKDGTLKQRQLSFTEKLLTIIVSDKSKHLRYDNQMRH